ncbi:MAG: ATP-binding cassette domain-containing protein [Gemmatimonadales bacterium]
MAIEFVGARYAIGERTIVGPLDLEIRRGETMVFLGESGSGKTTSLRLINRLATPSSGEVRVNGQSTLSWDPVELRRGIGYVIQDAGLLPHLTVARNVGLVPELERRPASAIRQRVEELLDLVGMPAAEFARRYPRSLSGGQRQRVGIARALAADPPILLCDEPFGSLDARTRATMQREFRDLVRRLGKTVVFVTHDLAEALRLADRIGVFDSGQMTFVGTPDEFVRSTDPAARVLQDPA